MRDPSQSLAKRNKRRHRPGSPQKRFRLWRRKQSRSVSRRSKNSSWFRLLRLSELAARLADVPCRQSHVLQPFGAGRKYLDERAVGIDRSLCANAGRCIGSRTGGCRGCLHGTAGSIAGSVEKAAAVGALSPPVLAAEVVGPGGSWTAVPAVDGLPYIVQREL